jgi:hypothetical protein
MRSVFSRTRRFHALVDFRTIANTPADPAITQRRQKPVETTAQRAIAGIYFLVVIQNFAFYTCCESY